MEHYGVRTLRYFPGENCRFGIVRTSYYMDAMYVALHGCHVRRTTCMLYHPLGRSSFWLPHTPNLNFSFFSSFLLLLLLFLLLLSLSSFSLIFSLLSLSFLYSVMLLCVC
ncbi:hypothetical protein ACOSQ4_013617 [Xanthoceras sorbifolium]